MIVADAVATRRSVRAFKDTPVPFETVERVLEQARWAPSGCNYQPWEAIVLTGAPLKALQDRLLVSQVDNPLEYVWSAPSQIRSEERRVGKAGGSRFRLRWAP